MVREAQVIDLKHKNVNFVNTYSQSYDAWRLDWCTELVTIARDVKDVMLSGLC